MRKDNGDVVGEEMMRLVVDLGGGIIFLLGLGKGHGCGDEVAVEVGDVGEGPWGGDFEAWGGGKLEDFVFERGVVYACFPGVSCCWSKNGGGELTDYLDSSWLETTP